MTYENNEKLERLEGLKSLYRDYPNYKTLAHNNLVTEYNIINQEDYKKVKEDKNQGLLALL